MTEAARYDPAADDDTRLETAIARRNLTWADFEAASQILRAAERAGREEASLQPLRRNYNRALDDWEWATRELVRERRRYQLARLDAAS